MRVVCDRSEQREGAKKNFCSSPDNKKQTLSFSFLPLSSSPALGLARACVCGLLHSQTSSPWASRCSGEWRVRTLPPHRTAQSDIMCASPAPPPASALPPPPVKHTPSLPGGCGASHAAVAEADELASLAATASTARDAASVDAVEPRFGQIVSVGRKWLKGG